MSVLRGTNWVFTHNSGRFIDAFAKLRKATISFFTSVCLSVRPSVRNNSAPTGRIFMKFYMWVFFENLLRKFKCRRTMTRTRDTLH